MKAPVGKHGVGRCDHFEALQRIANLIMITVWAGVRPQFAIEFASMVRRNLLKTSPAPAFDSPNCTRLDQALRASSQLRRQDNSKAT